MQRQLGDPAVNITFGAGSNPGAPLLAATTSYQYASDPCPHNGYYSVQNSGIDCRYGWHVLTSDHTGDPNGYFMIVDASFDPGDFYLDTVKTLCANTTYEFAAWMLNMKYVTQGIRPNVTFKVETEAGVLLQSYNTGDIPVEQTINWKQYGFYFTTPANISTIVLRMINNAPGGDGNDLALDDITFRPCGPIIRSAIQGNSDTVKICEGDSSLYSFSGSASSAYINPVYHWQLSTDSGAVWKDIPGASAVTYLRQPTGSGTYWYRLAVTEQSSNGNIACRIASNNLVIYVQAKPDTDAGTNRIVLSGDTINLSGTVTGVNPVWYWDPPDYLSDSKLLNPVASPEKDIRYSLMTKSELGCKNEDTVFVRVVENIFVPTAFTPNSDGRNDHWRIPFLDPFLGSTVSVFNRYGQLVYRADGVAVDWDGTFKGVAQPPGLLYITSHLKKGGRI